MIEIDILRNDVVRKLIMISSIKPGKMNNVDMTQVQNLEKGLIRPNS